jgi:glycosyltransferase involved in cell wall biosynthesis
MLEPTISVVIFGRNNEDTIEKVLKSAQPFADEILYMDTGSTDKTLEIVRQFTKRIYIVENMIYRNNANFRNFLNSEVNSKWTFFLDTDEVITQNLASNIKYFLKGLESTPNIHHVFFKSVELIHDEKHMLTTSDFHPFLYHPRLALKEYAKWIEARHENYIGEGEGIFWDIFAIVHYNLLDTKRLRNKLVNDNGLYGEYGETNNINITDEEVLKKFIGQADIGEVPKEVIW